MSNEPKLDIEKEAGRIFLEFLREAKVSLSSESIDGQIHDLNLLSECLEEIARVRGGIGFTIFHHAKDLAHSIEYSIGNLRRIKELCGVIGDWQKNIPQL